jgi:hypothetical protein
MILVLFGQQVDSNISFSETDKRICKRMRKAFRVRPGQSWGDLSPSQQEVWLEKHCDQFFCKKHRLEGKGFYTCVELDLEIIEK